MLVVGLTGGIASGKTTAAQLFQAHGVPALDADVIARQVVERGSAGLAAVAEAFGSELISADGTLDRAALRERIFASPAERQRLESILHPLIRAEFVRQLSALRAPYVLLVAPLLIEAELTDLVDRILVVDVPEELQLQRVMQRDGSTREQASNALAAQLERSARLAHADDVIRNEGELDALASQVAELHALYLRLAGESTTN